MRLLLWGVFIFVVLMLFLHVKKSTLQRSGRDRTNEQKAQGASETIIRCAQCGVHIPVSEAVVLESGIAFCSEEHRLKHLSS
jgi:uncharacterized protein